MVNTTKLPETSEFEKNFNEWLQNALDKGMPKTFEEHKALVESLQRVFNEKTDDEDEKINRLIYLSVVIGLLILIVYLGVLIFE